MVSVVSFIFPLKFCSVSFRSVLFRFALLSVSFCSQVVSDSAVFARDFLAGAYMTSKDRAGEVAGATVHKSLQVGVECDLPMFTW